MQINVSGWQIVKLGQIFETITGTTPSKSEKSFYGGDVPFIKPPELLNSIVSDAPDNLSFKGAAKSRVVQKNSILVSCIGNLGKIGINSVEVAVNQQINVIKSNNKANPWFMFYQALSPSFQKQLHSLATGTTVPIVNKSKFNTINIVLPSLPEQELIVEMLDEAFEAIKIAKANTEKNITNSQELFESELNRIFVKKGDGWLEKELGEVCSFQGGSQPPKSDFSTVFKDGFVRLIQIRDYKSDDHKVYIPKTKSKRYCLEDDVMIGRYGPPLFQILRGIEGSYNVALIKVTPNEDFISKNYLYYFLKNRDILQYIVNASNRAAGQIGLNKATIGPYPIPFPNKTKQPEIVSLLDNLLVLSGQLESTYQKKLTLYERLKQSILYKAFTGELTADKKTLDHSLAEGGL